MMPARKRILVVEDNAALARVVQFNLERAGHDVVVANNGQQALAVLAGELPFDMVVTDQQMPVMTGVELCQQMRRVARFAHLPVIMLTAKGLELELSQLRDELGIAAVLPKPFSPHGLVEAIEELLAAAVS